MLNILNIKNIDNLYSAMMRVLSPKFGSGEAREIIRLIFLELKGWNASDIIVNGNLSVSEYLLSTINRMLSRINNNEPVQYVTGKAHFHGLTFSVNPSVLIPRPETAQLVDIIADENNISDLRILDIGTGSGCIAISLARTLPFSKVYALEISEKALETARRNASDLKTDVTFIEGDILSDVTFNHNLKPIAPLDIIVSNPPYIDENEKAEMEANVLDYEPSSALFVPDDNPLLFYKRIIAISSSLLKPGGILYFEINPRHANELKAELTENSYINIEIIKDFCGKDRFISASLPSRD